MRNVTPQFLLQALPILLGVTLSAQEMGPDLKGGGGITVAGRRLEFKPTEAVAGPPQGGLKVKLLRLQGTLRSPQGEKLAFELQFAETGQIYRMNLFRITDGQEVERWAATMKTKVEILKLDGRIGGTVRLRLSGPLSGIVAGAGRQESWSGELWYTLQSWPEAAPRR